MCGTPVIAYKIGGGGEIVINKQTGLLFNEQTPEAIERAVREFETMKFDREAIATKAKRFSKGRFKEQFLEIIRSAGFSDAM